jgi:hypothetical protein
MKTTWTHGVLSYRVDESSVNVVHLPESYKDDLLEFHVTQPIIETHDYRNDG